MGPLDFIKSVGRLYGYYPEHSKGCYKFMMLMIGLFGGEGYYNDNHCLTKIGDYYYDCFGRYTIDDDVYDFYDGTPVAFPVRSFKSIDKVYGWEFIHKVFSE